VRTGAGVHRERRAGHSRGRPAIRRERVGDRLHLQVDQPAPVGHRPHRHHYRASAFVASTSQFVTQGETTTPVSGLGDQAFSSTLAARSITNSTIVVLKGSASLLVTGSASLAQVEALATQLLPHI
jgi:hypothetical protein